MPVPSWPAINYDAQFDNFSLGLTDGAAIVGTDMDSGEVRFRRRFNTSISPLTMSIEMTTAELVIFKQFFKVALRDGAFWFYMPIFDGTQYAQNLVRFDKQAHPVITPLGWDNYSVTLSLRVRNLS